MGHWYNDSRLPSRGVDRLIQPIFKSDAVLNMSQASIPALGTHVCLSLKGPIGHFPATKTVLEEPHLLFPTSIITDLVSSNSRTESLGAASAER